MAIFTGTSKTVILNARVLYVGYFLKKADVMKSVLEKTSATPDPIA